MLKIRVGDFRIGSKEKEIINEVLDSGRLSEGPKVKEFEEKWAQFIGTKYCVVVNSGTSALIAALFALKRLYKIKDKAKVITSPLTFVATINAIIAAGMEPVFADTDKHGFVIDPERIEETIKRQKDAAVILPVHLMGYTADMERISALARKNNLLVMEDAAQAHGSIYNGKKAGALSSLGCFSFYIAHNIQAGEMGAVVTDDLSVYKQLKKIKAHGRACDCFVCMRAQSKCPKLTGNLNDSDADFDPRFYHDSFGFNFKTMEFQAALGIVQLKEIEDILKKRRRNVAYLNKGLESFRDILQLPDYNEKISYLAYPVVIKSPEVISRKRLRYELERSGIETRPLFGCVPFHQPAYAHLGQKYEGKLVNAEYTGANGFYIGCHQYLEQEHLDLIISVFNKILRGLSCK